MLQPLLLPNPVVVQGGRISDCWIWRNSKRPVLLDTVRRGDFQAPIRFYSNAHTGRNLRPMRHGMFGVSIGRMAVGYVHSGLIPDFPINPGEAHLRRSLNSLLQRAFEVCMTLLVLVHIYALYVAECRSTTMT